MEDVSHTVDVTDEFITYRDIQLTIKDFHDAVLRMRAEQKDYSEWTFGKYVPDRGLLESLDTYIFPSLKRGEDGKFNDSELAALIKNAYVIMLGCTL